MSSCHSYSLGADMERVTHYLQVTTISLSWIKIGMLYSATRATTQGTGSQVNISPVDDPNHIAKGPVKSEELVRGSFGSAQQG